MKKLIALCCLLASITMFAQQTNIWYFGKNAGVDFNGGPPVSITGSPMSTDEGCATVCDASGNLIFLTDGTKIWDQSFTHVNPSTPLYGHSSATQSAVVVPKPGSTTNYYIFTVYKAYNSNSYGVNYTEVNASSGTVTIVGTANNNLIAGGSHTEKLAATCNANGTGYWIGTFTRNGDFHAFPVTSGGVGTAVVTTGVTSGFTQQNDYVGAMKFSFQGDRVAFVTRGSGTTEAFSFSNSTGQITTSYSWQILASGVGYGLEFSPDGSYLYTSHFGSVQQHNMSLQTSTVLFSNPGGSPHSKTIGALQLGPDGQIYCANGYEGYNGSYLDQIANPNSASATYNDDFVSLASGTYSRLGLPVFVNCLIEDDPCEINPNAGYYINQHNCMHYYFNDLSSPGTNTTPIAWHWDFGDGGTSNLQNPDHLYTQPGHYTVCVTITAINGEECCEERYCFDVFVEECEQEPCWGQPHFDYAMDANNFNAVLFTSYSTSNYPIIAYLWDFGDGTTGNGQSVSHSYAMAGTYTVCLTIVLQDPYGECCIFKVCYEVRYDGPVMKTGGSSESHSTIPSAKEVLPSQINLYPNPSNGEVHVEYLLDNEDTYQVYVIDTYGNQTLLEENVLLSVKTTRSFNLSQYSSGTYVLLLQGKKNTISKKLQLIK